MAADTQSALTRYRKSAIGLQVAAVGFAASFFYAPAGLAIGLVGLLVGFKGNMQFNDPVTRSLFQVNALLYAAALYLGSQSWLIAASGLAFPMLATPNEAIIRRAGFRVALLYPIAAMAGAALLLASWPPTVWWVAAALPVVMYLFIAKKGIDWLRRAKRQNRDAWKVEVGAEVPDFELPVKGRDEPFRLSEARGQHVLVQFTRGDWCPICHVIMRLLKKDANRLKDRAVKVVVISPTSGDDSEEFVRGLGLPYAVLTDPEHVAAKLFGCLDSTAFNGKGAPVPATFIIGPDGRLRHNSESTEVTQFIEPRDALRLLGAEA